MLQKCESSLNIRYRSNILTEFNYLKVVLPSSLLASEGIFIVYDLWGKKSGKNEKKILEKSGNFERGKKWEPLFYSM